VDVSLVIPAYNAAAVLAASLERAEAWLAGLGRASELIVVDDGSTDGTARILAEFAPRVRVLRHHPNRGKGYAVRRGMLAARGRVRAFLDAGQTYPVENIAALLAAVEAGADVAIGSRVHRDSAVSPRQAARRVAGRAFNVLVRAAVVRGYGDTQAGIKAMTAAAAEALFGRARADGFAFDVELLYLARRLGLRIAEVGIRCQYGDEPSTLRLLRHGAGMVREVAAIRARGWRGAYGRASQRVDAKPSTLP